MLAALTAASLAAPAAAAQNTTQYPPMLRGDTPETGQGWEAFPLFTVGDSGNGFTPPGILDGIGALRGPGTSAYVLVNHELGASAGYAYTLANGTTLTGARITGFQISRKIVGGVPQTNILAGITAFDTIYDRFHNVVTSPAQVNETGSATNGLARLCSSVAVAGGTYGFVDSIYFTGEETGKPSHPHGGSLWALDVKNGGLWAVPMAGRMAWENVTPMSTGNPNQVALLCGDDDESNPLYLYVGDKNAVGDGSFLDRNGLKSGRLYAWRSDNGDTTPEQFKGLNASRTGAFVEVSVFDAAMAGQPGWDAQGYADIDTLHLEADALGCFDFSRPEDLAVNPLDGTQAVFASTGRGSIFPSDNWGDLIVVHVDFSDLSADMVIVHDADSLPVPDAGIRSPDNLDWAKDGKIYVQEDRSTSPSSLFGGATGIEASVWQLDPVTRGYERIAVVDRSAVAPTGSTDSAPTDIGNWESSGVLDVTDLFETLPGERLLIVDVQAHSVKDGPIGGSTSLAEGGQLLFLSKVVK
jgi:hypothetical protein